MCVCVRERERGTNSIHKLILLIFFPRLVGLMLGFVALQVVVQLILFSQMFEVSLF